MLDVEDYLSGHGGRKMRGASGWQSELDCPWCGKPRHLYAALEKRIRGNGRVTYPGDFVCMKCDERGRFVKLFAELEGIDDRAEARRELMRLQGDADFKMSREKLKTLAVTPDAPVASLVPSPTPTPSPARADAPATRAPPPEPEKVNTPLPPDYTPCWDGKVWRVPSYLAGRGLTRSTLRTFKVGYSTFGDYGGRIILPISCPEGRSFTTRAIDPSEKLRYKAGPGAGRLLFGYDQALLRADEDDVLPCIVVVEGPFDVMSVFQAGFPCVGIMGKRMKGEQVEMICALRARQIILMLDGDALKDAIQQAPAFGARAVIAGSLGAKDANEAGPAGIQLAVTMTRPIQEARVDLLSENLGKIRGKW